MNRMIPPRRMLPRWRDSASAASVGVGTGASTASGSANTTSAGIAPMPESVPGSSSTPEWGARLERELVLWRRNPDIGTAADILSFAVHPQARPLLGDVASYLMKSKNAVSSPALLDLADLVARDGGELKIIRETTLSSAEAISRIRKRLREYPANPIALADLAWVHATLGHSRAAHRSLLAARTLAPSNRYIVQALSRYLVHTGDALAAQRYLETTPSIRRDPWLLSALIAVTQITGRPSKLIKHARSMLSEGKVAPFNLSELAGSFATLEAATGNIKGARRYFDIALVEPTENVLAQLHWVAEDTGRSFEMKPQWKSVPRAFELQTFKSYVECDAESALVHAWNWHKDEPFSSRPLVLASFLLDAVGRNDDAIFTCRMGLLSNPADAELQNNLIYSLIATGQLVEAQERLDAVIKKDPSIQTVANAGYLCLKIGQEAEGRMFYERAIELFNKKGDIERAVLAQVFYARSLRESGYESWSMPLEKAKAANAQLQSPAVAMVLSRTLKAPSSQEALSVRRGAAGSSRWRFDKATNTLFVQPTKLLQLR